MRNKLVPEDMAKGVAALQVEYITEERKRKQSG